jgi:hypothetical protein
VVAAGALLVVTAVSTGLVLPSAARADEVAVAQARVDKLQNLVRTTTKTLTEGTARWEADQNTLRVVSLHLKNTQRHVAEAGAVAKEGQASVAALARRLYMNPTPGPIQLAFTRGPDSIMPALQAQSEMNYAAGTDAMIVARAKTAQLRLRQEQAVAEQLTTEAQDLVDRSAKRLKQLEALAQSTADQLVSAQDALQRARARRAAAQARAAAARAASARDARERASRLRATVAGTLACTGKSTDGQQNGNLDPASLCPLWMAPGQRLRGDAAAAFNRMSKYHAATVGGPLCVTDSYRSYSQQVSLYQRKPGLAAVPGTSEHGWGKAVDFCGGIENTGSAAYDWMKSNAGSFGWIHPDWAEPSGSKPEPWHWEFNG